jgi:Zn-dependent peptidase ImmA (M78 family)
MALKRGFKTEANKTAKEIRQELKLAPVDPINPWKLAEYLEIPVLTLSEMHEKAPVAVHYFSNINTSEFSALTVFNGPKRIIVYNDAHIKGRQANDVAHEISHGLLLHPAKPALDDNGCRDWDQDLEDEANCLSGTLLIPEEAALKIARQKMDVKDAAAFYGTSMKMVQWRLSVTAAYKRVARSKQYFLKPR